MADALRITNMPDPGSPERVAYDLYVSTRGLLPSKDSGLDRIQQHMRLYSHCFHVVRGGDASVTGLE